MHMSTCYPHAILIYNNFLYSDEKLKMDMFGSSVNGFGTESSDLDMSLTFEGHNQVIVAYCSDVYSVLQALMVTLL